MDAPQVWLCLGTAGEGWQGENCELKGEGGGGVDGETVWTLLNKMAWFIRSSL